MKLVKRIIARLRRDRAAMIVKIEKKRLINTDFTILSQNCIGGVFYHDMGLRFTSPTINLFFTCPDFIKFVRNLEWYLNQELQMTWGEKYPIGYLDDIAICFQHFDSCDEAKEKWEERKKRINRDKILILCTDMEEFSDEIYEQWKHVPFPKVLFSAKKRNSPDVIFFPEYAKNGKVGDLIPDRKFYKDGVLIKAVNSMSERI